MGFNLITTPDRVDRFKDWWCVLRDEGCSLPETLEAAFYNSKHYRGKAIDVCLAEQTEAG